ncbi:glycosyltransferase [Amphritea atlantica]|uniref:Glycosyltransferase n=1 Tax=Amphritea atlantica TaxID=355243 RepID=A0ABY5GRS4_9GAMM|nr:glycosyltransferase [Amphritea atlantica]
MLPRITIVTVVYNAESVIRGCIESVLSQDYENFEYIVIDGGSSDSTVNIINEYRDQLSAFVSESDEGMYYALNKGLKYVKGGLWASLNADDRYSSNSVLSRVADSYIRDSSFSIYYGDLKIISDNKARYRRTINSDAKDIVIYGQCSIVTQPSSFINFGLNHSVVFDTRYKCAADYDYIVRCALNGKCKRLDFCVTDFYRHEGSVTEKYSALMQSETDDISKSYVRELEYNRFYVEFRKIYLKFKRGVFRFLI